MKTQSTVAPITQAELRMLQSIAETLVREASSVGASRCRFGRFELTAQCFTNDGVTDTVAMGLIVSCAGEVIERDMGLVPRHR